MFKTEKINDSILDEVERNLIKIYASKEEQSKKDKLNLIESLVSKAELFEQNGMIREAEYTTKLIEKISSEDLALEGTDSIEGQINNLKNYGTPLNVYLNDDTSFEDEDDADNIIEEVIEEAIEESNKDSDELNEVVFDEELSMNEDDPSKEDISQEEDLSEQQKKDLSKLFD